MPSIRPSLTTRQNVISVYSDPHVYALADVVARRAFKCAPGHRDYRRHVTCFLVDLEARVHGNRSKTGRHLADSDDWSLRRNLAFRTTGRDVLLAEPPPADVVRKWRYRFLPSEQVGEHLPESLTSLLTTFEQLAVERAQQLGQFPTNTERDINDLNDRCLVCADGTYLRPFSQVRVVADPENEDQVLFVGSRARHPRLERDPDTNREVVKGARVQQFVAFETKNDQKYMGVNHVVVMTRSEYGRIILSIERALGGEGHAALRAMDRVAPLAGGGIHGLAYDKALDGWQRDYLMAHHGIVSVAPLKAARGAHEQNKSAQERVATILAAKKNAAANTQPTQELPAGDGPAASTAAAKHPAFTKRLTTLLEGRVRARVFDIAKLVADYSAGRALGSGLQLGTSVYLRGHESVEVAKTNYQYLETLTHGTDDECTHRLFVDDGALWSTRLERGLEVKDQRACCTKTTTNINPKTGWHQPNSSYELVCTHTGEVLTFAIGGAPSGEWRTTKSDAVRSARQNLMPVAPCDSRWRKVYGRRNDTESWFSWLKEHILNDKRAASLDLNHQLLDVLQAAVLTNATALFHYRRESGNR